MMYKIVILGDGGVGKTALVIQTYDPTIEDSYRGQAVVDGIPCVVEVLDTAGQGEYAQLRDLWISNGQGFILVYSISSRPTFERIERFQAQILRVKNSDTVPIILVGNKCDKETEREVSIEEGKSMGRKFGCKYIETSAKTCINVDRSFHTVVRMLREGNMKKNKSAKKNKKTASSSKMDGIRSKEPIHLYDYSSFNDVIVIGDGAFGTISSAFSRGHNKLVVLKSVDLKHFTLEQLDNELKLHSKAKLHDNILGFYGITKKEMMKENYVLVLEYANEGNLRNYLKSNFNKMDWNIKLRFSKQIVSAVMHLHSNDIVHRDLHSENILIHDGNIKICDFGIAKFILDPTIEASKTLGTILYSDPEYLKDPNKYSRDKKSDIYSIGVLFWEISSGRTPFIDNSVKLHILLFNIILGARETIIKGTPIKYAEIYKACWKESPNLRPDIIQVIEDLDNVDINDTIEETDKYYDENGENNEFNFNLAEHNNNGLQSNDLSNSMDISSLMLEKINSLDKQLRSLNNPESNQDKQDLNPKQLGSPDNPESNQDKQDVNPKKTQCIMCIIL